MRKPEHQTFVVGVGAARTAIDRDDVNTTELAWEAVSAALADAGVDLPQIEGAVTASQDFWEGRTISSMSVNEISGGTLGSEAKVAADGVMALLYATARIDDSDQGLNIVLAHSKESQADAHAVELGGFDPYFERPLGPDERVVAAMQASLFYEASGASPEHSARVVAAARSRSEVLDHVTVDDVLSSNLIAEPLRELDRAPYMDAATALVICDGATAEALGRPAARIAGGSSCAGAYWSQRDLTRAPEIADSVEAALSDAGWSLSDLTRIDINAPFAHQHLLLAGELGFGNPDELVSRFEGHGDGPALNPGGGWLSGSPGSVAGLDAAANAIRELRGASGRALVHGSSGLCHQSHGVVLIEGVS